MRKTPTQKARQIEKTSIMEQETSQAFSWFYAEKAIQPMCFRLSCGVCGPAYAVKRPFSAQESAQIERCYLNTLTRNTGATLGRCAHNKIDFVSMRQRLEDGTEREVYRESKGEYVNVGGDAQLVLRNATACPHVPPVEEHRPVQSV